MHPSKFLHEILSTVSHFVNWFKFEIESAQLFQHEDVRVVPVALAVALRACHHDVPFPIGTTMVTRDDVLHGSHVLPGSILIVVFAPRVDATVAAPMVLLFGQSFDALRPGRLRPALAPFQRRQADLIPLGEV